MAQRSLEKPFFSYIDLDMPKASDYAQQTKLLDWQFNEIWQTLEQQALLAKTLVIITADQALPAPYNNSFAKVHTQVPMLIYWQGVHQEFNFLSSHLDIMPTLLNQFFGVSNPIGDYSQGIDLTTQNERLWLPASSYKWNVAIMSDGVQYHIDKKGHFEKFSAEGQAEKSDRPPLPLFLHMIQQSNQFIAK